MNFKHLQYFWATAKAGGIVRAGEQLHISPQTLSGQIKLLEDRLGCKLFRKSGRRLELTEQGRVALGYAERLRLALGGRVRHQLVIPEIAPFLHRDGYFHRRTGRVTAPAHDHGMLD